MSKKISITDTILRDAHQSLLATRMRTEVMPTTVFLEFSIGNLEAAVAVSMLMVLAAMIVLVVARVFGLKGSLL